MYSSVVVVIVAVDFERHLTAIMELNLDFNPGFEQTFKPV